MEGDRELIAKVRRDGHRVAAVDRFIFAERLRVGGLRAVSRQASTIFKRQVDVILALGRFDGQLNRVALVDGAERLAGCRIDKDIDVFVENRVNLLVLVDGQVRVEHLHRFLRRVDPVAQRLPLGRDGSQRRVERGVKRLSRSHIDRNAQQRSLRAVRVEGDGIDRLKVRIDRHILGDDSVLREEHLALGRLIAPLDEPLPLGNGQAVNGRHPIADGVAVLHLNRRILR